MSDKVSSATPQPEREAGNDQEIPSVHFEVRTAYSSRLNGLAHAWPACADELFLSGPSLRLWVAAAGEPRPGGYALGLDAGGTAPDAGGTAPDAGGTAPYIGETSREVKETGLDVGQPGKGKIQDANTGKTELVKNHEAIDAALTRAGLSGTVSDDGRYYVITGRRRLRRLAELVGDRPEAAPAALWPGTATA